MASVGLDVGTGFVKCVSDGKKTVFPSLYAYRNPLLWEDKRRQVRAVGADAAKMSENPDAIVIRPVMQGCPVNEEGFCELVRHALDAVQYRAPALPLEGGLHLVVGLPYDARAQRDSVKKTVSRLCRPQSCHVVPQAIGTLVDANLTDAIIVSIGQGTTEIVAFQGGVPVKGVSSRHAVGYISSRLGTKKTSHLDIAMFDTPKAAPLASALLDSISDDLGSIMQGLGDLDLVFSGGGIMIPAIHHAVRSKYPRAAVPKDPVMSNAQGLYRLALGQC